MLLFVINIKRYTQVSEVKRKGGLNLCHRVVYISEKKGSFFTYRYVLLKLTAISSDILLSSVRYQAITCTKNS